MAALLTPNKRTLALLEQLKQAGPGQAGRQPVAQDLGAPGESPPEPPAPVPATEGAPAQVAAPGAVLFAGLGQAPTEQPAEGPTKAVQEIRQRQGGKDKPGPERTSAPEQRPSGTPGKKQVLDPLTNTWREEDLKPGDPGYAAWAGLDSDEFKPGQRPASFAGVN